MAIITGVVLIVTTPPRAYACFALYAIVILVLLCIGRVPVIHAVKRVIQVIPFILVIAVSIPFLKEGAPAGSFSIGGMRLTVTSSGLDLFYNVLIKSCLSVICMVILTATTRFDHLLLGMESMKCPPVIVMVLSFMYRYAFLLTDELLRLTRAKDARTVGRRRWLEVKTLAGMIGVLFIRAFDRAERVYLAMCSRGFDGTIVARRGLKLKQGDVVFLAVTVSCFLAVRFTGGYL